MIGQFIVRRFYRIHLGRIHLSCHVKMILMYPTTQLRLFSTRSRSYFSQIATCIELLGRRHSRTLRTYAGIYRTIKIYGDLAACLNANRKLWRILCGGQITILWNNSFDFLPDRISRDGKPLIRHWMSANATHTMHTVILITSFVARCSDFNTDD